MSKFLIWPWSFFHHHPTLYNNHPTHGSAHLLVWSYTILMEHLSDEIPSFRMMESCMRPWPWPHVMWLLDYSRPVALKRDRLWSWSELAKMDLIDLLLLLMANILWPSLGRYQSACALVWRPPPPATKLLETYYAIDGQASGLMQKASSCLPKLPKAALRQDLCGMKWQNSQADFMSVAEKSTKKGL